MKTVSLELAKQLKEAGYPPKGTTMFRWMHANDEISEWRLSSASNPEWIEVENFAAPTADEILDQLPYFYEKEYLEVWKEQWGDKMIWLVGFELVCSFHDQSLADAAAKLWLYLKKEDTDEDTSEKQPFTK